MKFAAAIFSLQLAAALPQPDTKKHCTGDCQKAAEHTRMSETMKIKVAEHAVCVLEHRCPTLRPSSMAAVPCLDGMAGEYPCENVDMLSFVSLSDLGCESEGCGGNDVWYDPIPSTAAMLVQCV